MNTAKWKSIPEFTNYKINSLGHVKRVFNNGKVRFYKVNKDGFVRVSNPSKNTRWLSVVKLVADLFGGFRPKTLELIDGDITNAWIDNIRLVPTKVSESVTFNGPKNRLKHHKHNIKVYQYDSNHNLVAAHPNIRVASEKTGIDKTAICRSANYRRPTAGGFVWRY